MNEAAFWPLCLLSKELFSMPTEVLSGIFDVLLTKNSVRETRWKISEVNTVAFLPTAGIFRDWEGLYLLENIGRGERI